jgi:hypothetical protein
MSALPKGVGGRGPFWSPAVAEVGVVPDADEHECRLDTSPRAVGFQVRARIRRPEVHAAPTPAANIAVTLWHSGSTGSDSRVRHTACARQRPNLSRSGGPRLRMPDDGRVLTCVLGRSMTAFVLAAGSGRTHWVRADPSFCHRPCRGLDCWPGRYRGADRRVPAPHRSPFSAQWRTTGVVEVGGSAGNRGRTGAALAVCRQ